MSMNSQNFIDALGAVVGKRNVLTGARPTRYYRSGFRIGAGSAEVVVLPTSLLELWRILEACVEHDRIIIMQAANTGLNGGSTPYGDEYDRDVVIINTMKIDTIQLLGDGEQVLAYPGATLYELEDLLEPIDRSPHSVIGSSCIGASIIGGICNNSGGNLVQRGPAYTEMALYAQINADGNLELVNHLELELGNSPEEILSALDSKNFDTKAITKTNRLGSDHSYQDRVRDTNSPEPARYNADPNRLYEAAGCAGKLAVFAARVDTFEKPKREQVFYIGSNDPKDLSMVRKRILSDFKVLPESGEYMHRSFFDGSAKYCKDTFLIINVLGSKYLPKLFKFKAQVDGVFDKIPLMPKHFSDRFLYYASKLLPPHLPKRIRQYREKYEHHLVLHTNDGTIDEARALLNEIFESSNSGAYFSCNPKEGNAALLHRFVAGSAPGRFAIVHAETSEGVAAFDVALPRNYEDWDKIVPQEFREKLAVPFLMGHFFCHVFHLNFVVKKGVDIEKFRSDFYAHLTACGAKYPAEHNVGHVYKADAPLVDFYQALDPTNSFNPGIGKTSRHKHYSS